MSTHPPPYSPTAPARPAYEIQITTNHTTRQVIVTQTVAYPLPTDWWKLTCDHATRYDPEFCRLYTTLDEDGALLCLNGYNDAATAPFHQCYWVAIDYFLTKIANNKVPKEITAAVLTEVTYWSSLWRKWNSTISNCPWDLV